MFKVSPASLQTFIDPILTLTPSAIPNPNYIIMVIEIVQNIFACFLCCNYLVHRDFLIILYIIIVVHI
jgi:hypothetical protein